jgi:ABC-type multidrug transport system fused ATPase/permease subunit
MDGTLTLGVLVAFISYMKMFFRPIRDMAEKYNIMQSAMASCERIFLLFDTHDRIAAPARSEGALQASDTAGSPALFHAPDNVPAVHFDGVWFAYQQDRWVIKDFCLEVRQGETVAIVGATGAGKSTIVHLLERFYDPQQGAVRMGGVDLRKLSEDAVRSQIALISQDVFLFADTIRNNIIAGGAALSEDRLKAIVDGCNLNGLIARLPQGLDTVLTEAGRTMSSGERQLIAFARALAKDARILILDEATSSIDTETEQLIQEVTLRIMEGRTAIVVAHRLSTIRHADRIVVMHKGSVKEIGTHDALMAQRGLYYRLYQWQALSQDMEVYEKTRKT